MTFLGKKMSIFTSKISDDLFLVIDQFFLILTRLLNLCFFQILRIFTIKHEDLYISYLCFVSGNRTNRVQNQLEFRTFMSFSELYFFLSDSPYLYYVKCCI